MGSQVHVYRVSAADVKAGISEELLERVEAKGGGVDLDKVYLFAEDILDGSEDEDGLLGGFLHGADPEESFDGADMCIADAESVAAMVDELDRLDAAALSELEGASDDEDEWITVLADIRAVLVAAREAGDGLMSVLR